MVKRVNANLPDEIHKSLRIALAEDETNFAEWLRVRIDQYLAEKKGKRRKGKEA